MDLKMIPFLIEIGYYIKSKHIFPVSCVIRLRVRGGRAGVVELKMIPFLIPFRTTNKRSTLESS